MIYAVKMHEYNKGAGHLRRCWSKNGFNKKFRAGDATPKRRFIPSQIVEVTEEQYEYLTGRDGNGLPFVAQPRNPSIPVFKGFKFGSRRELAEMVQREADGRASRGNSNARAMMDLMGPLESVVEQKVEHVVEEEKKSSDFKPMDVQAILENDGEPAEEESVPKEESEQPARTSRRRGRKKSGS